MNPEFLLRRLAATVPTLLVLVTVAFFLIRLAPGGPFDDERELPAEIRAELDARYRLDQPLHRQYLGYLGDLLRGDFGPSFQYRDVGVNELIAQGLPVSLLLGATGLLFALLAGTALGTFAALHAGRAPDRLLMALAMTGIALPGFVLAPLLVLVFAVQFGWLPAGGWGSLRHLLLPALALGLAPMAWVARLTRGALIEVLAADYIRTARAKGLSEVRVVLRHALPPALLPVLSWLGPAAAALLTGSVVVEQVFGLPGLGRYFVQGALNRDYTLVLGVVVVYGALIVLFNLVVDLLYPLLDPRIRHG
jgi:oligopeptide transport system permease protein